MRLKRWQIIGLFVFGAIALIGTGAYRYFFHDPLPEVSAAAGEDFFFHRDLGARYQTGLPYPLALAALERYPEELGGDRETFCEKFGVLQWPDDSSKLPVGFVLRYDRLTGVDLLMSNCSLCHSAMVDGQIVPGLGNRNIRLEALNRSIMNIASKEDFTAQNLLPLAKEVAQRRGLAWGIGTPAAIRKAIEVLREQAHTDKTATWGGISGLDSGPGRNTPVEFGKSRSHVTVGAPYGYTKIPTIWVYGLRETFACDGSIEGDRAIALAAVEFNKGMTPAEILHRMPEWESIYAYLREIKAPAYPNEIDQNLAQHGAEIFSSNCSECHGEYEGDIVYSESVIPLDEIGTDPDRILAMSDALVSARRDGPLAELMQVKRTEGYVPPPLLGIWCRGPYLHNGSVPTLEDMLRDPSERPTEYFVGGDTAYDLQRVGIAYEEGLIGDRRIGRRFSESQYRFATTDDGSSNQGHEFGTDLSSGDKAALLEYLKTL
ncbi:MAG: hypothetical protein H8E66_13545 [Planctomycetes bacterium]|nr:hypothetical protein [Planctomycetota bacterium]